MSDGATTGPARVLIIDDNVPLAENLKDVLSGVSHLDVAIEVAPDGKTGLEKARARAFDVAVVDVKLPDASGLDLVRSLRATSPQGEIVLVTGFATVDTAVAALRTGAFAFILKSFRPEELIATVEQALEKIALRREREEYERRYRALVDTADVCIVGLDPTGAVALFGARLSQLTGVPSADALGQPFAERFIDEPDRARWDEVFVAARDGDRPVEVELALRDADETSRLVRWHLSGVRDDREHPDLVFGIGVDVTERRELERRVAHAEALNAMAPLALGLAHEIRNPLNAAVLELHLLSRAIGRLGDPEVAAPMARRVEVVESEIRRLERLLTEFLELARPRAPQRERVDLVKLVGDVLDLEAEAIAQHGVTLERELTGPARVVGDPEKLKQVVLNLVVNALDAMSEGGSLTVRVFRRDEWVHLSLLDSGPGIDPKILAEIFDPFFTTKPAGTGLGLAIVRKILDQHGGEVQLVPRPEGGTLVDVEIPAAS